MFPNATSSLYIPDSPSVPKSAPCEEETGCVARESEGDVKELVKLKNEVSSWMACQSCPTSLGVEKAESYTSHPAPTFDADVCVVNSPYLDFHFALSPPFRVRMEQRQENHTPE